MRIKTVLLDLGDTVFGLGPLPADIPDRVVGALSQAGYGGNPALGPTIARAARDFYIQASNAETMVEADLAALAQSVADEMGVALTSEQSVAVESAFGAADIGRFLGSAACGAAVRGLRESGLRVGVVSNTTTPPGLLSRYLESIGVAAEVEAIVYSVAVGRRKPHSEIYLEALRQMNAAAESTVFVGDRVREDVRGPISVGMRAVLTHEFRQEDPIGSGALAVIRSLGELPGLIAEPG